MAKPVPLPTARPVPAAAVQPQPTTGHVLAPPVAAAVTPPRPSPPVAEVAPIVTTPAHEVAAVKRAVELVRQRKSAEAADVAKTLSDPLARKLIEWVILRNDDNSADATRYAAFIATN